uniref:Galectin n=2 Tax=Knipowitschia caucasica TaxID=637954 RepID=A0AAV2JCU7_KNICA
MDCSTRTEEAGRPDRDPDQDPGDSRSEVYASAAPWISQTLSEDGLQTENNQEEQEDRGQGSPPTPPGLGVNPLTPPGLEVNPLTPPGLGVNPLTPPGLELPQVPQHPLVQAGLLPRSHLVQAGLLPRSPLVQDGHRVPQAPLSPQTPPGLLPLSPQTMPYSHKFHSGLEDKTLITIAGTIKPHANMFMVDFRSDSDLVFHFNPRFNESGRQVIVRNSEIGRKWGKEERDLPRFPFTPGQAFEMKIMVTRDSFKVAVNNSHLLEFKHREGNLHKIHHMAIHHDVVLSRVTVENLP